MISVCRRELAVRAALQSINSNQRMRRELIWLRAKEKGLVEAIRFLERIDPGLRSRMVPVVEEIRSLESLGGGRVKRDVYSRIFRERLLGSLPGAEPASCDCEACVKRRSTALPLVAEE